MKKVVTNSYYSGRGLKTLSPHFSNSEFFYEWLEKQKLFNNETFKFHWNQNNYYSLTANNRRKANGMVLKEKRYNLGSRFSIETNKNKISPLLVFNLFFYIKRLIKLYGINYKRINDGFLGKPIFAMGLKQHSKQLNIFKIELLIGTCINTPKNFILQERNILMLELNTKRFK
jgi:hypothetical protein